MLREDAYNMFKSAMFEGSLVPGQFVSLRELSETLNTSIAPMRDAIGKLELEGLIEAVPKRGIKIVNLDHDFVVNAFQVRRILEVQACREAIQIGLWEGLKDIQDQTSDIKARAEKSINTELLREAYEVDWLLHNELIRSLNNSYLTRLHASNSDRIRITRLNRRYTKDRVIPAMLEHLEIIAALMNRDEEAAARAMDYHIRVSQKRSLGPEETGLV